MNKQIINSLGFVFLMLGLFFVIVFTSSFSEQALLSLNRFASISLGILFLFAGIWSLNASRNVGK